MLTVNRLAN